jgi:hypothetical protein
VSGPFSLRNINRGSRFVAIRAASGDAAPIITARKSPRTRNTGRYAGTVRRNGGLATPITGNDIASDTRPRSSATANSSTSATKGGGCAILQTTTQLST